MLRLHKVDKKYIKNSILYFGASFFSASINILINPLLAKNLSHFDYAIIGYFTSFNLLLLPVLSFNLLTYYTRTYYLMDDYGRKELSQTILLGITMIGIISLLIFSFIFSFYNKKYGIGINFLPLGLYAFLQIFLANYYNFYLIKLRVENNAIKYLITSLVYSLIYTLITLLFVYTLKKGAEGKLFSALIVALFFSLYSFYSLYNRKIKFNKNILIKALKFGLPLTLSGILWYFMNGIDRSLLVKLNDEINYGLYIVAVQLISYLMIFYSTLNNTFETEIFRYIAEKKIFNAVKLLILIWLIIIVINVLFYFTSPFIINFLTGGRYNDSLKYVKIFVFMNLTMVLYYLTIKLLIGFGLVKIELIIRIFSAIISVILLNVFINKWGFIGAAWAQVLGFFFAAVLCIVVILFNYKKYGCISVEK